MIEFLKGKKTYIVVAAMVLYAGLGLVLGYQTQDQAITLVLDGLAIAGLRLGMAKK